MKKIRIAHIITRMDWGGSPDLVRIICAGLDRAKYEITLISGPTLHAAEKTKAFMRDFDGTCITVFQLRRDIALILDCIALIRLYFILRLGRFDIVHTHTAKAGALGRLASRMAGVPVIIHSPHGHNLYGYFSPAMTRRIVRIERFLSRFTDRIIAGTQLEKKDYLAHAIGKAQTIDVIYAGLELQGYAVDRQAHDAVKEELGIVPGAPVVGMIGRLEQVKGPDYFVDAAMRIAQSRRDVYFVLVGEGSLRSRLEDKAAQAGCKDRIIFTGWRNDVPRMLALLDIMVLPSLNEAVGLVLVEAQSQGIPVIASNVGGIPETIKDNETGILVPPGHAEKFMQAIVFLLDHADKRRAMGAAAQAWVESRFKAEDMTAHVERLYDTLLHAKNIL
ncbi:MAG TPA: glycosyltransferase family 4 protein [Candidatus Omnitrophota bacterium]|nr:glycosyltransferase family 4 protein [Candidatus Omnitrophota bacterium]HQQ06787.1 glycosyltransferase family 4 protein [Candidatus Omnitrophota bacterium]